MAHVLRTPLWWNDSLAEKMLRAFSPVPGSRRSNDIPAAGKRMSARQPKKQ
jgi:hypothetical protein